MITVKTGGMDRELGATILGRRFSRATLTCYEAANRILTEMDGWPRATSSSQTYWGDSTFGYRSMLQPTALADPMDSRGVFLPNGGCTYIDLGHPEICTPECRSADQYANYAEAMISLVQDALCRANARMPEGEELALFVDNSDRQGNSYGAHLNVTISRTLWESMFRYRLYPYLHFLASFQASSVAVTGGGKVGSEDGTPAADYQLSRRADFIKTFVAEQTTYNRPMVNARDEALGEEARLHCIFWDAVRFPSANYLQFGCLQIITAMMEAGLEWMPERLLLESPIEALRCWSRDPSLTAKARCADGRQVTALEHQSCLIELASQLAETDACAAAVADVKGIIDYWAETVSFLQAGDEDRAARRVEWLAKKRLLESMIDAGDGICWQSPEIRQLDLCFSDLNGDRGLFYSLLEEGVVDRLSTDVDVARCKAQPPADTRAFARTSLLSRLGDQDVVSVDWAEIRVRRGSQVFSVRLPQPDQAIVPASDLTAELVRDHSRRYRSLHPYISH